MIVSFSFENWMSFRDKVTISAVASKQLTHVERVPLSEKYKIRILPVLGIYGGNASGKSNIFKALRFARKLIVEGTGVGDEIDVQPFLLSSEFADRPSRFWFELLINEEIYEYSFSVTRENVFEEKLVEIKPSTEKVLYERKKNNRIVIYSKDKDLEYIGRSTRGNQLFLTNCMILNNEEYKDIYRWFRYVLKMISPTAQFGNLWDILDKNKPYYKWINNMFKELDTGIIRLDSEDVEDAFIKDIAKDDEDLDFLLGNIEERYFTHKKNGEKLIKRLVLYHEGKGGTEVKFSPSQESDGTMRLLDLLPAFLLCEMSLKVKDRLSGIVSFVDELDRSIHYLLLRRLLERMLLSCNKDSRSQLIFTTHDLLLMDQELLRRDEILFVERDDFGISSVIPLNEYKGVRLDKDIRKSYLQGRFGGVPKL